MFGHEPGVACRGKSDREGGDNQEAAHRRIRACRARKAIPSPPGGTAVAVQETSPPRQEGETCLSAYSGVAALIGVLLLELKSI